MEEMIISKKYHQNTARAKQLSIDNYYSGIDDIDVILAAQDIQFLIKDIHEERRERASEWAKAALESIHQRKEGIIIADMGDFDLILEINDRRPLDN